MAPKEKKRRKTKKDKPDSPAAPIVIPEQRVTRLSANVPSGLYKQLRLACVENDETVTNVIIRAMEQYVENQTGH